ncbi:unnamed protein product [Ambrosiozyma monospora]|uniref:Unnamed protein product n=1 Tax=Ambrosiozyma monospora TaxID=43982 RepID=A0A9W6Z146_AMBMO|nr:unnamed protein product [Ambrosiozyma monospora]
MTSAKNPLTAPTKDKLSKKQQRMNRKHIKRNLHKQVNSTLNECLNPNNRDTYFIHHVDDCLVLSEQPEEVEQLLESKYKLSKNGAPTYFIGHEISIYPKEEIQLTLGGYITGMIDKLPPGVQEYVKRGSRLPMTNNIKRFADILSPDKEPISVLQDEVPMDKIEQPVYTRAELESVLVNDVPANLHHLHDTITLDDTAFEDYPAALKEHIFSSKREFLRRNTNN